ncbi:hypothetical protein M5W68_05315 [Paenibacillus larvae]|uniref:hypothetical protein n=1 Tax=Paenibacillus larvae TaxID=1464 RepID=UPI00228119D6|nr:hypothetical protein [Paenibacillus larvae]MCY9509104.1 hypothetical protein [Paenibacillus larvae]MCY9524583.1 hypothetical protein [Paenibacillus larvae]
MRSFTWLCTLIGTILCLMHWAGHNYDPMYMIFYALSIPAWIAPLFTDMVDIALWKMMIIYLFIVLTWGASGFLIDWLVAKQRRGQLR